MTNERCLETKSKLWQKFAISGILVTIIFGVARKSLVTQKKKSWTKIANLANFFYRFQFWTDLKVGAIDRSQYDG